MLTAKNKTEVTMMVDVDHKEQGDEPIEISV